MSQRIFVVEDDSGIRELVVYTLRNTGFLANGFADGEELFAALREELPDLILLDIMLPGQDGITLLKRLRSTAATKTLPIIMLTAKSSEYDKVLGLDNGADDYVTKPFGMMELVSRIRAVLRRKLPEEEKSILTSGGIRMDIARHAVYVEGEETALTYKEFALLKALITAGGNVLTRDLLLERIWGYDFAGETRTVDVHVRTLRQKLKTQGERIETVRGIGYRISAN